MEDAMKRRGLRVNVGKTKMMINVLMKDVLCKYVAMLPWLFFFLKLGCSF